MNSVFLNNYDKINLHNDIQDYVYMVEKNIENGNIDNKLKLFMWFLENTLELLQEYEIDYKKFNNLEDEEYQNILNTIQKIINKQYYGFTK